MASIDEIRQQLEEKMEASGELGKIRAAVMSAGVNALSEEADAEGSFIFYTSIALKDAKTKHKDAFKVVADWLSDLGLSYTLNVLMLEASMKKSDIVVTNRNTLIQANPK